MFHAAVIDMIKWLVITLSAVFASYVISNLFASVGIDARKGLVGTYAQRNTLIVGFAMGFAVIPIIYTIAEDALNSVPDHLRAASIGCGATLWQTAVYVVLPTAASGVFSAVMIGLGRAVGETMIVVMAAGNTPIMDINIFNGLRALSATIAVELPEAVKDGTLYRVLFLSALVLFAMTFVINTLAEVVRIRFRKKATQL
jgi:phosphate transport system permease protein